MTHDTFHGSHEVKECGASAFHGLFDTMMDRVDSGELTQDTVIKAMTVATNTPSLGFEVIKKYAEDGILDIQDLLKAAVAETRAEIDPAVEVWGDIGPVALAGWSEQNTFEL